MNTSQRAFRVSSEKNLVRVIILPCGHYEVSLPGAGVSKEQSEDRGKADRETVTGKLSEESDLTGLPPSR